MLAKTFSIAILSGVLLNLPGVGAAEKIPPTAPATTPPATAESSANLTQEEVKELVEQLRQASEQRDVDKLLKATDEDVKIVVETQGKTVNFTRGEYREQVLAGWASVKDYTVTYEIVDIQLSGPKGEADLLLTETISDSTGRTVRGLVSEKVVLEKKASEITLLSIHARVLEVEPVSKTP